MGYLVDILVGTAGSLVAAELWSNSDVAAKWLIRGAVRRLPRGERERRSEEWLADLREMPGALRKLSWAVGCHWAATVSNVHVWRTYRKPAARHFEPQAGAGRNRPLVK
jgi:hypothetical protein